MCIVSPTGSSGTSRLRKPRKRPGERTGAQVHLRLRGPLSHRYSHGRIFICRTLQAQPTVVAPHRIPQRNKPPSCRFRSGVSISATIVRISIKKNVFKVICLPVGPRCDLCTLGTQKICPSAQTVVKSRTKKAIATVKDKSGPKIEIAIEETSALSLPKGEPASPCLSALSTLTSEPDDA